MHIIHYLLPIKYYINNDGTGVERRGIDFSPVKHTGNISHT